MAVQSRPLGEYLVARGVLSSEQLDWALAREQADGTPLAASALTHHLASESDILAGAADQLGVEFVDFAVDPPRSTMAHWIPEEAARRVCAVPVDLTGTQLIVALPDPTDARVLAWLSEQTGLTIRGALASPGQLRSALDTLYGRPDASASGPHLPSPTSPATHASSASPASPASPPEVATPVEKVERVRPTMETVGSADDLDDRVPASAAEGASETPARVGPAKVPLRDLDRLLRRVVEVGGSDLHLSAGLAPGVRIDGQIQPMAEFARLNGPDIATLVMTILSTKQQAVFAEEQELDTSYSIAEVGRFRVNVFVQRGAVGAVLRVIPFRIPDFASLGLPASVATLADLSRGLVLVTGPTGSGKSTTLASLVDIVNTARAGHIMTVEDPIEFIHTHKRCVVNQREVGEDTQSFAVALKHVLRQDPDVILVGEMRDLETISTALTAAETGHLVFGTLHTQSAPQAVDRIIDVFPAHQQQQVRSQLANALQAVVTQQLVAGAHGGRAAAAEVLIATPAVRNLVRESKTHQVLSAMQSGGKFGMQTMDQGLADLVRTHAITAEVALDCCHNTEDLRHLMSGS